MNTVDVRGRFVWHELMTRDVPGAKQFYSKLVGWRSEAWPHDPIYTVNHSAEGPQCGFFPIPNDMPAEMPANWVSYIGTRDVDGTVAAAARAGATILNGPADIKGAGRYAVLKDPQGAVFAILDPENSRAETPGMPPIGGFSWHELATTDHEAAFSFYSELFGWDALARLDMGPIGTYLIFGNGDVQRGGMFIKPAGQPGPASWLPYVSVKDVDVDFITAQEIGGKGLLRPMAVPGGSRIAQVQDPTGAAIAFHSPGDHGKAEVKKKAATVKPAKKKPVSRKVAKKVAKKATKSAAARKSRTTVRKKAPARKKTVARKRSTTARRKK